MTKIKFTILLFCMIASNWAESFQIAASLDTNKQIVHLQLNFDQNIKIKKIIIYRSYLDFKDMKVIDLYENSITKTVLTNGYLTYTDSFIANDVEYSYYCQIITNEFKTVPSNVVKISVPQKNILIEAITDPNILIDKVNYILELRAGKTILKTYPVNFGRNPIKRKLHQDNLTTPEGSYKITYLQPNATFYKAYGISYPNDEDYKRYNAARKSNKLPKINNRNAEIGGSIQIHGGGVGNNWTYGCTAMRNEDIDELFSIKSIRTGTPVRIVGSEIKRID